MLIKTERLCKTGYQKCLPRGDSANEVYLLKLPIKVMFPPGREKNKIKWKTDTSGFYRTLKYFIKSFLLLPNKTHRQSAQIPPEVPRHSQGCWCVRTLQATRDQTEPHAAICATCSAAVCSCSTRATFTMIHPPSECIYR